LKTAVKRLYEAMFLVDSTAEADWDNISSAARKILEKADAEIVSMKKWDERKLTYKINGRDRGMYILCYFHADGQRIRQIERDARLSEKIMRVLILSTAGRDKEDIERDITSQAPRKVGAVKADEYRPQSILSKTESGADRGSEATPVRKRRVRSKEQKTEGAEGETTAAAGNQ
jgi:small subunit ribosomal protein S6